MESPLRRLVSAIYYPSCRGNFPKNPKTSPRFPRFTTAAFLGLVAENVFRRSNVRKPPKPREGEELCSNALVVVGGEIACCSPPLERSSLFSTIRLDFAFVFRTLFFLRARNRKRSPGAFFYSRSLPSSKTPRNEKSARRERRTPFSAGVQGFEPRLTGSEPAALPLRYTPNNSRRLYFTLIFLLVNSARRDFLPIRPPFSLFRRSCQAASTLKSIRPLYFYKKRQNKQNKQSKTVAKDAQDGIIS